MSSSYRIVQFGWAAVAVVCTLCTRAWADTDGIEKYQALHRFHASAKGDNPFAAPAEGPDGAFYGTTCHGGIAYAGTAYKVDASGEFEPLHLFDYATEGGCPMASLVLASDGNFYGTTTGGPAGNGPGAHGAVFRMTPAGQVDVLHVFSGGSLDGAYPGQSALLQAADGFLYGTTVAGGASNLGTAYRISLSGDFTLVHSFAGSPTDVSNPTNSLMQASNGRFYGTAANDGGEGIGAIFDLTPAGAVEVLHRFDNAPYAPSNPETNLIQGTDGALYGTTAQGGSPYGSGTVFRISTTGDFSIVANFESDFNGHVYGPDVPTGNIVAGADGKIYGISLEGGTLGLGTIYSVSPAGHVIVLHSFGTSYLDGKFIEGGGGIMQASDGSLVGTTAYGGRWLNGDYYGEGTVYRKPLRH